MMAQNILLRLKANRRKPCRQKKNGLCSCKTPIKHKAEATSEP